MIGRRRRIGLEKRRARAAYAFIGLWLFGFAVFFLEPMISSIRYSFFDLVTQDSGGFALLWPEDGLLANYRTALTADPDFLPYLADGLRQMVLQVPGIVMFSLFIALLLSRDFPGRTFMRGLFFLPVIVTTGMISQIIRDQLNNVAQGGYDSGTNIFQSTAMTQFLLDSGMPQSVTDVFGTVIDGGVDIVWQSGVQILIFLSAILAIPAVYYEVAAVEGGTAWEAFWKITFPLMRPYILLNVLYSMIDMFSSYGNKVMQYMIDVIYSQGMFSLGSAMAWIYLLVMLVLIGLVTLLLRSRSEKA